MVEVHEIYNFLPPCPTDVTYQIQLKSSPVVLEKKTLTHDKRRTPTHRAIGHLECTSDLKPYNPNVIIICTYVCLASSFWLVSDLPTLSGWDELKGKRAWHLESKDDAV